MRLAVFDSQGQLIDRRYSPDHLPTLQRLLSAFTQSLHELLRSPTLSAHIQQNDDGAYGVFMLDMNNLSPLNSISPLLDLDQAQIRDGGAGPGYDGVAIPLHGLITGFSFCVDFPLGAFSDSIAIPL